MSNTCGQGEDQVEEFDSEIERTCHTLLRERRLQQTQPINIEVNAQNPNLNQMLL